MMLKGFSIFPSVKPLKTVKLTYPKNFQAHILQSRIDFSELPKPPQKTTSLIPSKNFFPNPPGKIIKNFSIFASKQYPKNRLLYFKNAYSDSHWAQHIPVIDDKNFIATLEIYGIKIALILNLTDSRGYRAIVRLVTDTEKNMDSTFNRKYKVEEKLALNTALCILATAYENYGMIAQIEIAGNNAQSITENGDIQLGNEMEPALLHGHIIGRGNPGANYIENVPLRGPKAGKLFNLRGDGVDEGNKTKTNWKDNEMEIIAEALAKEVSNVLESSLVFKGIQITSIRTDNKSVLGCQ